MMENDKSLLLVLSPVKYIFNTQIQVSVPPYKEFVDHVEKEFGKTLFWRQVCKFHSSVPCLKSSSSS